LHRPATHRGSHPASENTVGETDPPLVIAGPEVVDVSALDGPSYMGQGIIQTERFLQWRHWQTLAGKC
jgi:hypothetical protein